MSQDRVATVQEHDQTEYHAWDNFSRTEELNPKREDLELT